MIHSRTSNVVFRAPFTLPGLERDYPAGTYLVTTDDEQLDVSFSSFRRIGTTIALPRGPVTEYWTVAPVDLEAALAKDATRDATKPAP
ncbi:MAG: hypothetical protein ABL866_16750 [Devosia sp.]